MRILFITLVAFIAIATIPGVVLLALILFIFARALSMGWHR